VVEPTFEDLEPVVLALPFLISCSTSIVLTYWFYKDRNTFKLMFAIGSFCGGIGLGILAISQLNNTVLNVSPAWLFVPIALYVPIAAFTSLFKVEKTEKTFKIFAVGTAASIVMFSIPFSLEVVSSALMIFFIVISVPTIIYLFAKRRDSADLVFLLATLCYTAQGFTLNLTVVQNPVIIPIILNIFGAIFIVLMFAIPKNRNSYSLASSLVLKKQLDKANEDLRITEEKLLRAERFAAIGELSGMIGHDLRNPLQGISGATYYLKARSVSQNDVKGQEMVATIERCIEYSNKIISDLLEYSREIQINLEETNPKELIKDSLLQVPTPPEVEIINKANKMPTLKVDKVKIERVFINLIKNAYDAMPNGGKLNIKTETKGDNIVFTFHDTGVGMAPEIIAKLWTPLFTTKAKGMGFGLPICRRIVEAHGGIITVESQADKGSTFTVTLPKDKQEQVENTVFFSTDELLTKTDTQLASLMRRK
jgi:signal transduction histidine kinase